MDRSEIMRRIKGKNTGIELAARRKLLDAGMRGYRIHYGYGKADIAFVGPKIAIFLDSCFWHGCPEHGHVPKTNPGFWERKFARNKGRAAEVDAKLRAAGWIVLRYWEHEVEAFDPEGVRALARLSRWMDRTRGMVRAELRRGQVQDVRECGGGSRG